MNASVNASIPGCIDVFSAHGFIAVLHLSKDKKTSFGGRKKAYARKAIQTPFLCSSSRNLGGNLMGKWGWKKTDKKVKMAGDCGLNALSLLPENVLPQWQQKIALRAENPFGHKCFNVEEQKALKGRREYRRGYHPRYWIHQYTEAL